jgi:hypothetical protein
MGLLVPVMSVVPLRADEPPYFVIRDARIVPVAGPIIEKGTVVMAKGPHRGRGKGCFHSRGSLVIEGKGLSVYPGLMDALSDLGLQSAPAPAPGAPQAGAPSGPQRPISRGPEDRPATSRWRNAADELKVDDKRLETWRNAGFTSAPAAPRAGIFCGQSALINLAGERPGNMVVKAPATLNLGFQPMPGFWSFPDSLMGVLAYVRQVFLDANQYAQAQAIYDSHPRGLNRPNYDRALAAIDDAQRAKRPVLVPANNQQQILRALDLAERLSVRPVLYGGQQGYAVAHALAAKKVPVLASLKWPEKEKDADPEAEESLRQLRFRDLGLPLRLRLRRRA